MKSTETGSYDENDNSTCGSGTVSQSEKSKLSSVIKKARSKGRKLLPLKKVKKSAGE